MLRRTVNLKLLAILCSSTLLLAVGIHFLHDYMQEKNAGALLTLAEQAQERKELRQAAGYLRTYVNFRPDDTLGYVRWANLAADLAATSAATPNDILLAKSVLDNATLKVPQDKALRRRLVDINLRVGRLREARENLQTLVDSDPSNLENQVLLAQTLAAEGNHRGAERLLYKLIGYDYANGTFDPQQALGAHHVQAYVVLAEILRTLLESPEQADAVMNQLVAVNTDNFRSHLERGNYLLRHENPEGAITDIERAVSMAPNDADVMLASAEMELGRGANEAARKQLDRALEKFPDQPRFYRAKASLELSQFDNAKEALAIIEHGLKTVQDGHTLLSYKAELQLRAGKLSELDETIDQMVKAKLDPEVVSFYRARKMLAEQQWVAGARELERLRPLLAQSPDRQMELNLYLGLCYERLGQPDRALEAYQLALRSDARQQLAREGVARVQRQLGRIEKVAAKTTADDSISQRVTTLLKLPEAERNWQEVDELLTQQIRDKKLDELASNMVWARMMGLRGEFATGLQMLEPMLAKYPQDPAVWLLAIDLARQERKQGVAKAVMLADKAERSLGDRVDLRLARAVLLMQRDGRSAATSQLEEHLEKLSRADRRRLWSGLATLHLNYQRYADVRRLWQQLANDDPNDLAIRLQLVELALQENNVKELIMAQKAILELVKSEDDSAWQYSEAGRLLLLATNQNQQPALLNQAVEHVDRTVKARPQWNLAHALRGRILLQLGRYDDAIAAFQRSLELGTPRAGDLRQLVQLLTYRGRFAEAQKAMNLVAGNEERLGIRPELLAEIHLRSGDQKQGLVLAEQAVKDDPKNALKLLWYGQVLARSGKLDESAAALQRAVDAAPRMPQCYLALFGLYAQRGQEKEAAALLETAKQHLEAEQLPLVLARGEELLGHSSEAEKYYQQSLNDSAEGTVRLRALATFYLTGGYRGNDGAQKAAPLVEKVLQSTSNGLTAAEDTAWARRAMAMIRASGGTYPDLVAALALIEQNAVEGKLGREDQMQAAMILAQRPEAVSRRKAIRYLQELQDQGELPIREQLVLANLYNQMDNWPQCHTTMLQLVGQNPKEPLILATFARMLLDQKAIDQAQRYITRLIEIDPAGPSTLALQAEVLLRQNKAKEAAELVTAQLPSQPTKADISQLARAFVTLRELKLYPEAERVMRQLALVDPKNRAALAEFLGYFGNIEEAFQMLASLAGTVSQAQLAQVSTNISRARREEIGNKFDPQIESWLKGAQSETSAEVTNLQTAATLADLQARYADEEQVYRQLLSRTDVKGNLRALILNNLAFNLAMRSKGDADARKLVDEAIQIHGPTGALLDTRAMVSLLAGEHARAISDLNLAISDQAKPERLFHLALAQLAAGNKEAALRAHQEASRRGLDANKISLLERPHYDRLVRELGVAETEAKVNNKHADKLGSQKQG